MLKNDMRKYLIAGRSFEEFYEEMGDVYTEFSDDILARCWENTKNLIDRGEWLKYLKVESANYAKYLEMTSDALLEEGVPLNSIRAGMTVSAILRKQHEYRSNLEDMGS